MNDRPQVLTVVTRMNLPCTPAQVWNSLMFYEQIDERPPLLLRLLIPRPIRTHGAKSVVGDQATCLYEGGHLLKRVIAIEPEQRYAFSVVDQQLALGGGVSLAGGAYLLRDLPGGATELAVRTDYRSTNGPRWLMQPIETFVCHRFHRHLLTAIGRKSRNDSRNAVPQAIHG